MSADLLQYLTSSSNELWDQDGEKTLYHPYSPAQHLAIYRSTCSTSSSSYKFYRSSCHSWPASESSRPYESSVSVGLKFCITPIMSKTARAQTCPSQSLRVPTSISPCDKYHPLHLATLAATTIIFNFNQDYRPIDPRLCTCYCSTFTVIQPFHTLYTLTSS